MDEILKEMGYKASANDLCLYTCEWNGKTVYVLVSVDDIVVGCEDASLTKRVHAGLSKQFDITALTELKYFLGLEVERVSAN